MYNKGSSAFAFSELRPYVSCFDMSRREACKPVFEPTSVIPAKERDIPIPMKGRSPRTGSRVRTDSGAELTLGETFGITGGEADVYRISGDDTLLVKIYRRDTNTFLRHAKIRKLIERSAEFRQRCPDTAARMAFPIETVFSAKGDPVGFTMPCFAGMKPLDGRNIAGALSSPTRKDVIDLAISAAELAESAAENNLFLGDVLTNGNILFNDSCEAFFIDMDSTQFTADGRLYTSNVGKLEYLSPERLADGTEYSFVRTAADDSWSLALVIFGILTLIHPTPYIGRREKGSRVNSGMKADIINGRYGFYRGSLMAEIISNLPPFIRFSFYHTFSSAGSHFSPETRFSAKYWLMICRRYLSAYENGQLSSTGMRFIPAYRENNDLQKGR